MRRRGVPGRRSVDLAQSDRNGLRKFQLAGNWYRIWYICGIGCAASTRRPDAIRVSMVLLVAGYHLELSYFKLVGRVETWTVRFRDRKQCQQGVFPFWHAVWFP